MIRNPARVTTTTRRHHPRARWHPSVPAQLRVTLPSNPGVGPCLSYRKTQRTQAYSRHRPDTKRCRRGRPKIPRTTPVFIKHSQMLGRGKRQSGKPRNLHDGLACPLGLLQPRHPRLPAPTPHPRDHSRADRPTGPPHPPRRPATGLRLRRLQTAQHRRTLHQQTQTIPRRGHPIRQTRLHLRRHRRCGLDPHLAPRPHSMIPGTRPSGWRGASCRGSRRGCGAAGGSRRSSPEWRRRG